MISINGKSSRYEFDIVDICVLFSSMGIKKYGDTRGGEAKRVRDDTWKVAIFRYINGKLDILMM